MKPKQFRCNSKLKFKNLLRFIGMYYCITSSKIVCSESVTKKTNRKKIIKYHNIFILKFAYSSLETVYCILIMFKCSILTKVISGLLSNTNSIPTPNLLYYFISKSFGVKIFTNIYITVWAVFLNSVMYHMSRMNIFL